MISNSGCSLQKLTFCVIAISIVLKYSFACTPTKCTFRNEKNKLFAITNEVKDLLAKQAHGSYGIQWFQWRYIYRSAEISAENIGHLGRIEEDTREI